jgi:hypothetical protein
MPIEKLDDTQIAVDRQRKEIAVFNEWRIIRDYQPYTDETAAVEEARAWLKLRTNSEPRVVYPKIKSIRAWG